MVENELRSEYFEWLFNYVCEGRFADNISYRKLLTYLHETEFTYLIPLDVNRAMDGICLRYRFVLAYELDKEVLDYLDGPCSVFEMILALAIRCEENIMDDPKKGDRTGQWFWGMIQNLGVGAMMDDRYNEELVIDIITKFLNREYEPNGKGGLFTVKNRGDIRDVEIWYQLNWYLDNFI